MHHLWFFFHVYFVKIWLCFSRYRWQETCVFEYGILFNIFTCYDMFNMLVWKIEKRVFCLKIINSQFNVTWFINSFLFKWFALLPLLLVLILLSNFFARVLFYGVFRGVAISSYGKMLSNTRFLFVGAACCFAVVADCSHVNCQFGRQQQLRVGKSFGQASY